MSFSDVGGFGKMFFLVLLRFLCDGRIAGSDCVGG